MSQVPQLEANVLDLDYGEKNKDASCFFLLEDEEEEDVFVIQVQAAKSETLVNYCNHDERSTPAFTLPSSELFEYKCMADQLAIPWPAVVAETTRSHDKGKKDCLWPRVDPGRSIFPLSSHSC